jgi:phosphopantothenoylcysteine decarboxylase/phosphopantothenate--cysteine ligase
MDKKIIVLGVTGGIAAYKSAQLASNLLKKGYEVHVIMTKNATEFITPLTFEVLTNNKVAVDTFDRNFDYNVNHVSLAKKADLFIVVPGTANVIAKFAAGIADDMLTTSYLAFRCPILIAPAMNTGMLEHVATRRNIEVLRNDGVHFIASGVGYLACGDVGVGRLADLADIEDEIEFLLSTEKKLGGRKVVITAGPTQEEMDPVRFLSNHSSGKMGYALARVARNLGADVVLISGPTHLKAPRHVDVVQVTSANAMYMAAMEHLDYDFFVASAAVSDYRPTEVSEKKLKKKDNACDLTIKLTQNEDIVAQVASKKQVGQIVVAFAMETEILIENARLKLEKKQVDMVVANDLTDAGAGFKGDTNKVTLVVKDDLLTLPLMSKEKLAAEILDRMVEL